MSESLDPTLAEENTEADAEELATDFKSLNDLNLKELEDDIARVIEERVGGAFGVTVTKFEHVEIGNVIKHRLLISLSVEDMDWLNRKVSGKTSFL